MLLESVFSLLYVRGRYYTSSVQNFQKTQVKKKPKQQMLPLVGCFSNRRLHPPEVAFVGCIHHKEDLILEY